ncbi:MAG: hypothetical protein OES14_03365 [Nitrosopumilus sp.]|nr:hypothetical protein [Nitrosopumilus sp.]MDH3824809.1 hypothetical protein [Nitrosopumilus sp.]
MRLIQKLSNSSLIKPNSLVSIASVLAVIGPVIILSGGVWDAISHLQREPELFWTIQHISVYTGVSMVSSAGIIGVILLVRNSVNGILKKGIQLVIIGSIIQLVSGFGDSLSHDLYGIDGLISWSHQPLEFGIVLAALGGFLIIKSRQNTRLGMFLPFSIIALLLLTSWLGFNVFLIFGHVIQCIPVYDIFSSGCSIL